MKVLGTFQELLVAATATMFVFQQFSEEQQIVPHCSKYMKSFCCFLMLQMAENGDENLQGPALLSNSKLVNGISDV